MCHLDTEADDVEVDDAEYLDENAEELGEDAVAEQALALAASAFMVWHQWTRATAFMNARVVSAVWKAWCERTRQGAHKELLRRRAARFSYLHALRRALSQFQALLGARRARRVSASLQVWVAYTRMRRAKHNQHAMAVHHAQRQAMRRVLTLGFGANVVRSDAKRLALSRAEKFDRMRALHRAFSAWRAFYESEMRHYHELQILLDQWRASPSTHARRDGHLRLLLAGWVDYARSKSVARLVVANFRGRTHLRALRECFDAWVAHVSRVRWRQIKRERARTHLRRSTLRKSLAKWRERVAAIRNARNQTRMALVHWKISVEKRTFAKWVAYLEQKREKRQRLHDALQFRHSQLVTHGVRQWLTAAMHLQEVRETHAARVHAAQVARVWRRVASIARHWKLLTARRRRKRLGGSYDQPWTGPVMPVSGTNDDADWLARPQRQRLLPVEWRAGKDEQFVGGRNGGWRGGGGNEYSLKSSASPLSEFVMLPRNRPQPRKPVELMLAQQRQHKTGENDRELMETRGGMAEREEIKCEAGSDTDINAVMDRPREFARYGFRFPVDISHSGAPVGSDRVQAESREQRKPVAARSCGDFVIGTSRGEHVGVQATEDVVLLSPPSSSEPVLADATRVGSSDSSDKYAALLDALEQQLLRLQTRKREWREFQKRLADLRASHRYESSLSTSHCVLRVLDDGSDTTNYISSPAEAGVHGHHQLSQQQQFKARVLDMEREYHDRYRDWHDAQQRLREVAAELAQLCQDLQLQVSS